MRLGRRSFLSKECSVFKSGRRDNKKYKDEVFCSDHLPVFLATPYKLRPNGSERREGHRRAGGGFRLARCAGKHTPPHPGQKAMSAICSKATLVEIYMTYLLMRGVESFAASGLGPGCPKHGKGPKGLRSLHSSRKLRQNHRCTKLVRQVTTATKF